MWLSFGYLWLSSGYRLAIVWLSSGYCLVIVWLSSFYRLAFVWLSSGYRLVIVWLSSGYRLRCLHFVTDENVSVITALVPLRKAHSHLAIVRTVILGGGIRSTVVACWTAGQHVERSILHEGHELLQN